MGIHLRLGGDDWGIIFTWDSFQPSTPVITRAVLFAVVLAHNGGGRDGRSPGRNPSVLVRSASRAEPHRRRLRTSRRRSHRLLQR